MNYKEIIKTLPVYFENNGLYIKHIPEINSIYEDYKGFAKDEEIKDVKMKFFDLIKPKGINAFIADMTNFEGATPEIYPWMNDFWLPKICDEGINYIALILPSDVFGEFSLNNVLGTVMDKSKGEKFKTIDEAVDWIKQFK